MASRVKSLSTIRVAAASGVLLAMAAGCAVSEKVTDQAVSKSVANSYDGLPIGYEHHGNGDTVLLFVHCWSCDRSYWRNQVRTFSRDYQVALVDLAGHGESGIGRTRYTMESFAHDVRAVVNAIDAHKVILIGHSMGGGVIAEAARLMPDKVIALVGIDTLQDVGYAMTPEELEEMARPFEEDFVRGMRDFVSGMFVENSDKELVERIRNDMASAPKDVAISAFREYLGQYITGEAARVFRDIKAPVHCLNATSYPTAVGANRQYMNSFDVTIMEDVGHFPMLEKPEKFNELLGQIVAELGQE